MNDLSRNFAFKFSNGLKGCFQAAFLLNHLEDVPWAESERCVQLQSVFKAYRFPAHFDQSPSTLNVAASRIAKLVKSTFPHVKIDSSLGKCESCERSYCQALGKHAGKWRCEPCRKQFALPQFCATTLVEEKNQSKTNAQKERAKLTTTLRWKILSRDNFACQICGASSLRNSSVVMHVDHKTPIAKNGLTIEDNLWTLCFECNNGKRDSLLPFDLAIA